MIKKVFIRFWLLLIVSMTTVVVNSCGQNSNTKKEVTVKSELLSHSDAKSAANSLWEPIVGYLGHDIVLGMSHDEVRKYFGTPDRTSTNVHAWPGDVESSFDLGEDYYINGSGMRIGEIECSGAITFYYDRSGILEMVKWG